MDGFQGGRALVVEGGAMHGIFASGVLDAFLQEQHTAFDFAIGVSAGATNLSAYVTRQARRSHAVITRFARQREFYSPLRFLRGSHLTDVHWLWHHAQQQLPLDLKGLGAGLPLFVVATHVATGQPHYIRVDRDNLHAAMVASCALPFLYRQPALVGEEHYVDGGVADSIPVRRAYAMGAREITVVLSRPQGYRKPAQSSRMSSQLLHVMLREQPGLARQVQARAADYNASLDFIQQPPADCRVRVIAPPEDFAVRRLTMHLEHLERGYAQGWQAAENYLRAT